MSPLRILPAAFALFVAARSFAADAPEHAKLATQRYRVGDILHTPMDASLPDLVQGSAEHFWPCTDPDEKSGWTMESLLNFVQRTVEPDTWGDPGTSISGAADFLQVTQTPEVQQGIQRLLDGLRKERLPISLEACCYTLPLDTWRKIRGNGNFLSLDDAQTKALDEAVAAGAAKIIAQGQALGYAGHRVTLLSVHRQAYLQDLTAVVQVSSNLYDPEIGYVCEGMGVCILAILGGDDQFMVDLKAEILGPVTTLREQHLPRGSTGADSLEPEKPATAEEEARKPARMAGPESAGKEAVLELPEQDVQAFETSVQTRSGRTFALESTRPSPDKAGQMSVSVLLVKVTKVPNN